MWWRDFEQPRIALMHSFSEASFNARWITWRSCGPISARRGFMIATYAAQIRSTEAARAALFSPERPLTFVGVEAAASASPSRTGARAERLVSSITFELPTATSELQLLLRTDGVSWVRRWEPSGWEPSARVSSCDPW